MWTRRRTSVLVASVLAGAMLAGCADSDDDDDMVGNGIGGEGNGGEVNDDEDMVGNGGEVNGGEDDDDGDMVSDGGEANGGEDDDDGDMVSDGGEANGGEDDDGGDMVSDGGEANGGEDDDDGDMVSDGGEANGGEDDDDGDMVSDGGEANGGEDDDDGDMVSDGGEDNGDGSEALAAIGVPQGDDAAAGFTGGVVTAANPIAAKAGADVLAAGGNAVDAAVVVQFVLNVVEPTSSGIGGGGFMGIHLPDGPRTFYIDSREKAPAAATPTQYLTCDATACDSEDEPVPIGPTERSPFLDIATSGIGVGVPGTLLGIERALSEYGSGTYTLAQALEPAIELAEGFPINDRLAMLIAQEPTERNRTTFWPETAAIFRPDGNPLESGDTLAQPDLAKTLRLIAAQGSEVFYEGEIASAIVEAQGRFRDTVGEAGAGRMTLADLADYRAVGVMEREPVVSDYRGYTINGMPFPSSGGLTVAQILECVEQFPLGDADAGFGPGATDTLNVMIESMRLAFSSRSVWMGDEDADTLSLPDTGLLDPDYLGPRCDQIAADARLEGDEIEPGDPRPFDPDFGGTATTIGAAPEGEVGIDTTHFSIIDENGMVVSWTSTIEGTWGSGITVPGYGFLLNNELTDFNFVPQATSADDEAFRPGANDVAPGKRPRSSMAPTLVFAGDDFVAAYGSPGGSTIINSVVNTTINLIDHGMSVQEAIDAPRVSTGGGSVSYEDGFDASVLDALRTLGHGLRDDPSDGIGSVQAVVVDPMTGLQYGGADDRRAGDVVGLPLDE